MMRRTNKRLGQGLGLVLAAFALTASVTPVESAHAGACASVQRYAAGFAAAADSVVPADGGVLFVPTLVSGTRRPAAPGASTTPEESLRRGTRALRSERVELAPGWFVLRPQRRTTGAITGLIGTEQRAFVAGPASTEPLPPPVRPSLRYYPSRQVQGPRGPSTTSEYNSLALGGRAPAGAYGVVVRSVTAEGSPAAADGFALPIDTPEQTSFTFSPSGGRCQPSRPGNVASHGQDVEVLFVDAVGRTSEAVAVRVR
ncbi:MAG: hypothetical protein KC593_18815 [Myxococcales bacterium]|nr:hypothetical protein [Myxococcales bacterium]MCB9627544.1 hypothetical protein [Sandaracinaceae bacterium]